MIREEASNFLAELFATKFSGEPKNSGSYKFKAVPAKLCIIPHDF